MTFTTQQLLKFLYWVAWAIFVGVCIEAGGFLVNTFYTLVINSVDAKHFWPRVDLSSLYQWDRGYFMVETSLMCIVGILRVWIFWLIIKVMHEKKFDMRQPFSAEIGSFIIRISWLALITGLMSWFGANYAEWFVRQGVKMPELQYMRIGGADVWLFMGVTLYVIAKMFKRGVEIQAENDLTV